MFAASTAVTKCYAVVSDRHGKKTIYYAPEDAHRHLDEYPGSICGVFDSALAAERWLFEPAHSRMIPDSFLILQEQYTDTTMEGTSQHTGDVPEESMASTPSLYTNQYSSPDQQQSSSPYEAREPEIVLSAEQERILQLVRQRKNVFFTGSAGTGKSVLLRSIISYFNGKDMNVENNKLAITASTGIAGINIGGCTLHSWACIGLGKEDAKTLFFKLLELDLKSGRAHTVRSRWTQVECLLIDEVSMLDGILFDKLEEVARRMRKNDEPFGGIQLVLSGDFCQLPPVPNYYQGAQLPSLFAFQAKSWTRCIDEVVVLTQVFRQKDQAFVDMLNMLRYGKVTPEITRAFSALSRDVKYDDGIEPTELYPTRAEVYHANKLRLDNISGDARPYSATDYPREQENGQPYPHKVMQGIFDRMMAPESLELKVGAQVMLIKNLIQGVLVNGSIGIVIDFLTIKQALEKHMSIPRVEFELWKTSNTNPKDKGVESALDHLRDLEGEELTKKLKEIVPERILQVSSVWPAVRFANGRTLLCIQEEFEATNPNGRVEAVRHQVPLILAWALSIHKSQGQTLERVKVNLLRTFEKGQAYVALSRATNMNTLQVLHFDPRRIQAHQDVIKFMEHWMPSTAIASRANSIIPASVDMDLDEVDETLRFWNDTIMV